MTELFLDAVTGAFGYSGKYITRRLLNSGHRVVTLTNSPNRSNLFDNQIKIFPLNFQNPDELQKSLEGVNVLYNTYWVRFNYRNFSHNQAVENTLILFDLAKKAGVQKIVHISITNPSENSDLDYFRGKAILEKTLISSGISHAILRPTVLFGKEDILVNNIAWALRKFPIFPLFGDGKYKLQPIYVDDLAQIAVEQGTKEDNMIIDAIGPETFTYRELVETIAGMINIKRPILSFPPGLVYFLGFLIGKIMNDIFITRPEIKGLMDNLLYVESKPAGWTKLTDWIKENNNLLGIQYASELARRNMGLNLN